MCTSDSCKSSGAAPTLHFRPPAPAAAAHAASWFTWSALLTLGGLLSRRSPITTIAQTPPVAPGAHLLTVVFLRTYEHAGVADVHLCGRRVKTLDALWAGKDSLHSVYSTSSSPSQPPISLQRRSRDVQHLDERGGARARRRPAGALRVRARLRHGGIPAPPTPPRHAHAQPCPCRGPHHKPRPREGQSRGRAAVQGRVRRSSYCTCFSNKCLLSKPCTPALHSCTNVALKAATCPVSLVQGN